MLHHHAKCNTLAVGKLSLVFCLPFAFSSNKTLVYCQPILSEPDSSLKEKVCLRTFVIDRINPDVGTKLCKNT